MDNDDQRAAGKRPVEAIAAQLGGRLQRAFRRGRARLRPVTAGPWRTGNRFRLLVDAPAFYPAMLAAIAAAQHTVLIEIYLLESGHAADALLEALLGAVRRGVVVQLLADQFGARGLAAADRARLADGGVELRFYNPLRLGRLRRYLLRDHRKLLLVDGTVGFTGGYGFTDDYLVLPGRAPAWHDIALEMRGPVLADWRELFAVVWAQSGGMPLAPAARAPEPLPEGVPGRLVWSRPAAARTINRSPVAFSVASHARLWLATAYFIPAWRLRRALRHAARRGVDVRVLVPGRASDHPGVRYAGRRYYQQLLKAGVRIYEYRPRFLHAKLLLGDDRVSIGSSNFDRWNLRWNLEANLECVDPALAGAARRFFEEGFATADEIRLPEWRARGLRARCTEWFFGVVERFLDRER